MVVIFSQTIHSCGAALAKITGLDLLVCYIDTILFTDRSQKPGLLEPLQMEIACEEIQIFSCVASCRFVDAFLQ